MMRWCLLEMLPESGMMREEKEQEERRGRVGHGGGERRFFFYEVDFTILVRGEGQQIF